MNSPVKSTSIINIYGGPGIGKSTAATALFVALKLRGISCEYVPEFAKELSWKRDIETLQNQFYISAVQYERQRSLIGKVNFIITDAPVLQGLVYDQQLLYGFTSVLHDIHHRTHSIDILLVRDDSGEYCEEGRHHAKDEALVYDAKIEQLLQGCGVPFVRIQAQDTDVLINYVFSTLEVSR